jgi:thiosulfate reductase cytochrome b subunit
MLSSQFFIKLRVQTFTRPAMSIPKQNNLFRVVHAIHSLTILLLLITGLQSYNVWDQGFGLIAKVFTLGTWSGNPKALHLAFSWLFLANGFGFSVYQVISGRKKLFQAQDAEVLVASVQNWQRWNYALHRYINTALTWLSTLFAFTGLVLSNWGGMGMWASVLGGQSFIRSLHLGLVPFLGLIILAHLGLMLKVGGVPLILSAFTSKAYGGRHVKG